MASKKIHFNVNGRSACGRGEWLSQPLAPSTVTCLVCANQPEFIEAVAAEKVRRMEAFNAQEPRPVKEPWTAGHMICRECLGTLFREADRSCYGHYSNHVCANCGHTESRLTETGMSF
jgi:hypothetical protein